jgi:hypothetical protein
LAKKVEGRRKEVRMDEGRSKSKSERGGRGRRKEYGDEGKETME